MASWPGPGVVVLRDHGRAEAVENFHRNHRLSIRFVILAPLVFCEYRLRYLDDQRRVTPRTLVCVKWLGGDPHAREVLVRHETSGRIAKPFRSDDGSVCGRGDVVHLHATI